MQKQKNFSLLDGMLLLALSTGLAFLLYRLVWGMNYHWRWQAVLPYIYYINPQTGEGRPSVLLEGLFTTIRLSIWAMIFATLIGFSMGIMRTSSRLFFRLVGTTYITLIRNTPPLVLIFIFYYFISDQLFALLPLDDFMRNLSPRSQRAISLFFSKPETITPFFSGILTLALFQGAYIGEIVRAGIEAVDRGQWEASSALGLTKWTQLRSVILPQAVRTMLPTLANEFINTIKWSSIVSIISIQELTFQGMQVMASSQATLEVWLIITSMYLIICLFLSYIVHCIEKRIADPDRMQGLAL
ncbi:amino acid ABC transporter permease [Desulfotalea psychrophila]|uniref:Related to glutamine transport system permease protein (GlnP) n=1 Tax=Desulfotalea psychrophila (strain LSv54 / DSM 12343) TaxID=177439 RepID=Q6AS56_DESPS|nr:amino acid ABC transporter permease [Desulfotalea psychrophila]CAG34819.1 related to glutamine transport system permease protein (GlnP) [Desulfotalea psychrophila LSv54]